MRRPGFPDHPSCSQHNPHLAQSVVPFLAISLGNPKSYSLCPCISWLSANPLISNPSKTSPSSCCPDWNWACLWHPSFPWGPVSGGCFLSHDLLFESLPHPDHCLSCSSKAPRFGSHAIRPSCKNPRPPSPILWRLQFLAHCCSFQPHLIWFWVVSIAT